MAGAYPMTVPDAAQRGQSREILHFPPARIESVPRGEGTAAASGGIEDVPPVLVLRVRVEVERPGALRGLGGHEHAALPEGVHQPVLEIVQLLSDSRSWQSLLVGVERDAQSRVKVEARMVDPAQRPQHTHQDRMPGARRRLPP